MKELLGVARSLLVLATKLSAGHPYRTSPYSLNSLPYKGSRRLPEDVTKLPPSIQGMLRRFTERAQYSKYKDNLQKFYERTRRHYTDEKFLDWLYVKFEELFEDRELGYSGAKEMREIKMDNIKKHKGML